MKFLSKYKHYILMGVLVLYVGFLLFATLDERLGWELLVDYF